MYEAVSYEGKPEESEEMRPRWFSVENLPLKARKTPLHVFADQRAEA